MLGGLTHLAVAAIFLQEAIFGRLEARRSRSGLAAIIALVCGLAHLLSAVMFIVMREEHLTVTANKVVVPTQAPDGSGSFGPVGHIPEGTKVVSDRRSSFLHHQHFARRLRTPGQFPVNRRLFREIRSEAESEDMLCIIDAKS